MLNVSGPRSTGVNNDRRWRLSLIICPDIGICSEWPVTRSVAIIISVVDSVLNKLCCWAIMMRRKYIIWLLEKPIEGRNPLG